MNTPIHFDTLGRRFGQSRRTEEPRAQRTPPIGIYEAITEDLDKHLRRRIGDVDPLIPWKKIGSLEVWQMLESSFASGPDLIAGPTPIQFRRIRENLANIHPRLVPCTRLTRQLKEYLGIPTSTSDPDETGVTWQVERVLIPAPSPGGRPREREEPLTAQDMRRVIDNFRHVQTSATYDQFTSLYTLINGDPMAAAIIVDELKRLGY